jgi:hypothetical protein
MGNRRRLLRSFILVFFLLPVNLAVQPLTQAATITVVNGDGAGEGFNDGSGPDADSADGGNTGATLGAQRLKAFQFAADIWGALLNSPVTIKIDATFDPLPCSANSAVLGAAGPNTVHGNFSGAPVANTWYPQALANSLAGSDLAPATNDIGATFNSSVGTTCPFPNVWYYGLDAIPPASKIDFVSVVLHELGHGLGFLTFVDLDTGEKLLGFDDTYMLNLEDHGTGQLFPLMTDDERLSAMTNTGALHWVGAKLIAASGNLTDGVDPMSGHVEMYAPDTIQPGSSVSHFSDDLLPDELMEPFYTGATQDVGLTLPLLEDIGWLPLSGANIDVQPSSLSYGNVTVGSSSDQDVTVENVGTETLNVTGINLTGSNAEEFSIVSGGDPFSLEPGESQVITVGFEPTSGGKKSATLEITSDDADESSVKVALSGTGVAHDLAVIKVTAPKTVKAKGAVTKPVIVQFQNRGSHNEKIEDIHLGDGVTTGLVRLEVSVDDDDGEDCQDAIVELDEAKNAKTFAKGAKTLKPRQKLNIFFLVTYECSAAVKTAKGDSTPGDYSHIATVFHDELDGESDTHPDDDACPHDALPGNKDDNPAPKGVTDKGCGAKKADKSFGDPIVTDLKQ